MKGKHTMAIKANNPRPLKFVLLPGAIFCLMAGVIQFFSPGIDAILAGVAPGELNWIYRLLGCFYIALGIGMLAVYRSPSGQGIFVSVLIVFTALACVAFAVELATAFYPPIPFVLGGWILALMLLIHARQKAKDILTISIPDSNASKSPDQ